MLLYNARIARWDLREAEDRAATLVRVLLGIVMSSRGAAALSSGGVSSSLRAVASRLTTGTLGIAVLLALFPFVASPLAVGSQVDLEVRSAFVPVRNHAGFPPKRSIAEMVGSGVCVLDYDEDGRPDLYFPDGGDAAAALVGRQPALDAPSNRLFRNRGELEFVEVTELAGVGDAGYAGGCAAADVDNDGDIDLLVVNLGENAFFENRGDGTFQRATPSFGLGHGGFGTSAAFADLDADGWLDLYVTNYVDRTRADLESRCGYFGLSVFCGPNGLPGEADVLYRSDKGRAFVDVTRSSGVETAETRGFSVLLGDFDGDRLPDIHVANDATRDLLFRNLGAMQFEDESLLSGAAYSGSGMEQSGMGSTAGDFDGDGDLDFLVTNFQRDYNTLFLNQTSLGGPLRFVDETTAAGINLTTLPFLGWAALSFDGDHDGDLDLFVANGHIYPALRDRPEIGEPYDQPNQFFWNDGRGRFSAVLAPGPRRSSRGAALGDLDGDGDTDIVVTSLDDAPDVLLVAPLRPSVRMRLVGLRSNRDALGTRIEAKTNAGRSLVRELRGSDGYLGSNEHRVILGLGEAESFTTIRVFWPSGGETLLTDIGPGEVLLREKREWSR